MKVREIKKNYRSRVQKALFIVTLLAVIINSGCDVFGILANPGAFEKKIPPQYDLRKQQDRKILLWVECPRSSDVDYDVQEKLTATCQIYLTEKVKINPENIILDQPTSENVVPLDPVKIAQGLGAGYVLLVQVEGYELMPMGAQKYYSGEMITRTVLMDTDLSMAVWPKNPMGKVVHIGVDMETKGRDAALSRLVSSTAHCALRYLHPCEKLKFKALDEKITIQDSLEMETY